MPTTQYKDTTLAARAIGARTDAAGAAVADVSAEEDRLIHDLLTEGVVKPDNGFRATVGTGMGIVVGSGNAKTDLFAVSGDVAGQGFYLVRLDVASFSITIDAADASQQRTDEVYLVVQDNAYDASARGLPRLAVRKGDAGLGAPGVDTAWRASALLATVTVPAGATSIVAANIADNRTFAHFRYGFPTGSIQIWAGTGVAPIGWHLCTGIAISRTEFARLFSVIGTTYGAGDGSTTFNLPNFVGRMPIGVGTLGADTYARGGTGGSATHTLTETQIPSHGHTATTSIQTASHTHTATAGATEHRHSAYFEQFTTNHAHGGVGAGVPISLASGIDGTGYDLRPLDGSEGTGGHTHGTTAQSTDHSHSVGISTTGGGAAHENRPPYLGVYFIIKG